MSNEQYYLDTLEEIQKAFDALTEDTLEDIPLENIKLSAALKVQVTLQLRWEGLKSRINYLYNSVEADVEESYAAAISAELKDGYKSTTISEAREFAKCDANYKTFKRLLNEARLLKDEISGILGVIESRKYILNNMSNAIINSVDNHIL